MTTPTNKWLGTTFIGDAGNSNYMTHQLSTLVSKDGADWEYSSEIPAVGDTVPFWNRDHAHTYVPSKGAFYFASTTNNIVPINLGSTGIIGIAKSTDLNTYTRLGHLDIGNSLGSPFFIESFGSIGTNNHIQPNTHYSLGQFLGDRITGSLYICNDAYTTGLSPNEPSNQVNHWNPLVVGLTPCWVWDGPDLYLVITSNARRLTAIKVTNPDNLTGGYEIFPYGTQTTILTGGIAGFTAGLYDQTIIKAGSTWHSWMNSTTASPMHGTSSSLLSGWSNTGQNLALDPSAPFYGYEAPSIVNVSPGLWRIYQDGVWNYHVTGVGFRETTDLYNWGSFHRCTMDNGTPQRDGNGSAAQSPHTLNILRHGDFVPYGVVGSEHYHPDAAAKVAAAPVRARHPRAVSKFG